MPDTQRTTHTVTVSTKQVPDIQVGQFLATVIPALAWPLGLALIVYLLREQVTSLLKGLKTLKYGDFEFNFGEAVEHARAKTALIVDAPLPPPEPNVDAELVRSPLAPALMVIEAWMGVQRELVDLNPEIGLVANPSKSGLPTRPANYYINKMLKDGRIDERTASLLHELRTMRNAAAHSAESYNITAADALRYRQMAKSLQDQLHEMHTD